MRRRRSSPAERRERIEEYRRSGLTQREYVERQGMALSTLTYWLRRESRLGAGAARPDWVEVQPREVASGQGCRGTADYRVRFPSGIALEFSPGFAPGEVSRLCRIVRTL